MIFNRNGNGQFSLLSQSRIWISDNFILGILGIVTLTRSRPDEDQGREPLE